jgi:hypothetical protein
LTRSKELCTTVLLLFLISWTAGMMTGTPLESEEAMLKIRRWTRRGTVGVEEERCEEEGEVSRVPSL